MNATALCTRCGQRVRIYTHKRLAHEVLDWHAAPGQEQVPWEKRKPCGSTWARVGSVIHEETCALLREQAS